MTEYSKVNIVYRLQKWMDSVPGQTFLNYAYSWGAAVVILGTLFKLTHLPGANMMLFLGMGTEVVVFFLSAFDRPFDKTAEGRILPTHVNADVNTDSEMSSEGGKSSGTVVVALGTGAAAAGTGQGSILGETGAVGGNVSAIGGNVSLVGGGNWVDQQQETTPDMAEAQGNYVDELKKLTDMLQKVSEQSQRLTRDSEEMENLNRTLTGITKVYEMQLKGASKQIGTIDEINEQTQKMAQQIAELNSIYARMIEAMTVNMKAAAPINE